MRKYAVFLLINLIVCQRLLAESLLVPTLAPKTFEDLSFEKQFEIKQADYDSYASEYDTSGVCVKNCPYTGYTFSDYLKKNELYTEKAIQDAWQWAEDNDDDSWALQYDVPKTENYHSSGQSSFRIRQWSAAYGQYAKTPCLPPLLGNVEIRSGFGLRWHPTEQKYKDHNGIDYVVAENTGVFAPAQGIVTRVGENAKNGKFVELRHPNGMYTLYLHLNSYFVNKDDNVWGGDLFATTGNSGSSTGPHLHYSMKSANGNFINPVKFMTTGVCAGINKK